MLNRRFKFIPRLKRKKKEVPVTKEDLLQVQKTLAEGSQKAQAILEQRIETLVKLQTLTPRQRLRLIKAGIRRGGRHG